MDDRYDVMSKHCNDCSIYKRIQKNPCAFVSYECAEGHTPRKTGYCKYRKKILDAEVTTYTPKTSSTYKNKIKIFDSKYML